MLKQELQQEVLWDEGLSLRIEVVCMWLVGACGLQALCVTSLTIVSAQTVHLLSWDDAPQGKPM